MSDERIAARIAELEAAEKETEQQLIRIRVVIAELRALMEPTEQTTNHHEEESIHAEF